MRKILHGGLFGFTIPLIILAGVTPSHGGLPLVLHWVALEDQLPGDNFDGMISPGERVLVLLELQNQSGENGCHQVRGYLQGETTCCSFLREEALFGDIGPQKTAEAENGFELRILPHTPTDTLLLFELILSDSTGSVDTLPLSIYVVARVDSICTSAKRVYPGEGIRVNAYFSDGEGEPDAGGIESLLTEIRTRDGELVGEAILYDDGVHNDGGPGDGNFGNTWWTMPIPLDYRVSLRIFDTLGKYRGEEKDLTGFTSRNFVKRGDVLLVNDDRSSTPSEEAVRYYKECLNDLGLSYSYWYSWYRGDIDTSSMFQFLEDGVVIWCAPQGGRIRSQPRLRALIGSYLQRGGKLLISSAGLGHHISTFGSPEDSLFLSAYLHARPVQGFSPQDYREVVRGIPGDPISDGLVLWIVGATGVSQYYTDEIDPIPPALPIFTLEPAGRSSSTAALRVDDGISRLVYFTFGLEGIGDRFERKRLTARTLRWLRFGEEVVAEESEEAAALLLQNSPNPFSSHTRISYELPAPGWVTLQVCNLSGRVAKVLANGEQGSGPHSLFWDGRDLLNRDLANGYYFYRLTFQFEDPETQAGQRWITTNKMLLLR